MAWAAGLFRVLHTWRNSGRLLRGDRAGFFASGCKIEDILNCPFWHVRNIGIKLIVQFRLEACYPVLPRKLLEGRDAPILRRNCAEGLGRLRLAAPDSMSALRHGLKDPYWEVRTESLRALCAIGEVSEQTTAEILGNFFGYPSPVPEGADSLPPFLKVREKNFEVRAALARAIGKLVTGPQALAALRALSDDDNWIVRAQASAALAEFASRNPAFRDTCLKILSLIDTFSDGAVPHFVIRQSFEEARQVLSPSSCDPIPGSAPRLYLDLKQGWNKPFRQA